MEDYIFIIIAIILSVLGAFNRKNKKRIADMENDESSTGQEPSFFEKQFVDPFFDEEEEFEPEPVFEQPVVPRPEPMVIPKPTRTIMPEPRIEVKKDQDEIVEEETDEIEETKFEGIMKDFSLKKAVIYSEILQRKY